MTMNRAHHSLAAATTAVGIGVPEYRRTSRQHRGFFHVRQHGTPVFGRAVRGAFGLTGSCIRHANPHGSAHPIGVGAAVRQPLYRSLAMCQCTATPEAGAPMFHRAYELANLIGECRTVARSVPDVIPDGLGAFNLDKLQQISDLASVVARLVGTAEDLAYAIASDLHDVYLTERKGA